MMQRYSQYPWYIFLFAVYSPIALIAYNTGQVAYSAALRSLLIILAAVFIFTLLVLLIVRNVHKAGLIVTLVLILFFSYGHVYDLVAKTNSRVLEIGCGWGGLAEVAARDFEAHVTGVTLSSEQLAWAQQRLGGAGLAARCDLRLQDYRDLAAEFEGRPFDAIVSIEMFEAVGREYWDSFFDTLRRCLKPGGLACIQSITIRDDLFERYARSTDFIRQYIFPGGMLPSSERFEAQARRFGFEIERRLAFGQDYAETLRRWRDALAASEPQVRALGFDERFMRIWRFYLSYCEAAFMQSNTDVVQFTLRRV